jgi:hypothetical protein
MPANGRRDLIRRLKFKEMRKRGNRKDNEEKVNEWKATNLK